MQINNKHIDTFICWKSDWNRFARDVLKSVEYGKVYRSQKCPLSSDALKSHKKYVLEMFTQYMRETNKWVDAFLAGAWVDKYEEL